MGWSLSQKEEFWRTPKWGRIKAWVARRAGDICENCWSNKMEDVHHRIDSREESTYDNPDVRDLMGICRPCHDAIHDNGSPPVGRDGSPLALGVKGLDTICDSPGHWYRFRLGWKKWYAWHKDPNNPSKGLGLIRYSPATHPIGRGDGTSAIIEVHLCGRKRSIERYWSYIADGATLPKAPSWVNFDDGPIEYKFCRCAQSLSTEIDPRCGKCGAILCPSCFWCFCDCDDRS